MPNRNNKFVEPDETQTGEWVDHRETLFWHDRTPHEVKFEVEKLTGVLMKRDPAETERLTYTGESTVAATKYVLKLRFEAVTPRRPYMFEPWTDPAEYRNQFALRVEASAPRKWVTEEALQRDLNRAFEYWSLRLECGSGDSGWTDELKPLYDRQVQASLAQEEGEAQAKEDPKPVEAIQRAVLAALRKGKSFRTAHKEGGSILSFNGRNFVREDYGEEPDKRVYGSEAEMLQAVRNFYDWESRRDYYPHKPPALEVWRYIQDQLR
ncbi:hypothetical protein [uncultured Paludibaculum sp.]|uniref:hypothetical protein n=1 Tax=uncultured Paludibaculum sp. TaxID=1765020 RepID=UPI002AAA9F1E|nr:hypothetical protein [uncultured Paludibaculum sp.]